MNNEQSTRPWVGFTLAGVLLAIGFAAGVASQHLGFAWR